MATYTTFLNAAKLNVNTNPSIQLVRRGVQFARQNLDAGNGDVMQLIPVEQGDVVLAAWVDVKIVCPNYSTVDLGFGSVPNYWGNGLRLDALGPVQTILTGSEPIDFIDLPCSGGMDVIEIEVDGVAYGDQVTVMPSTDTLDLLLTGHVSSDFGKRITVQITNLTGEKLDLGAMTLLAIVNKAPLGNQPYVFTEADTIDITATRDVRDVNITSGIIDVNAIILKP